MKYISLILLILSVSFISCKKDPNTKEAERGSLQGVIRNESNQPVRGALVEIGTLTSITDAEGKYSFAELPAVEQTVSISARSYISQVTKMKIVPSVQNTLDLKLIAGEQYIYLSDSIISIPPGSGTLNVNVLSNGGWVLDYSSSWLSSDTRGGTGDMLVTLNYSKNEVANRIDTVHFRSGSVVKQLLVVQGSVTKITSVEGRIGNGELKIADSVYVHFNKRIVYATVESNWNLCLSEIRMSYATDRRGIKFSYPCADLGGTYPFTITLTDEEGKTYIEKVSVPFYRSRLAVQGNIKDYLYIRDEKEVLIATILPATLVRYSIEQDSVLQIYDLSKKISPMKLSYNPYNSRVYIMGGDPGDDWANAPFSVPDIYTLNPASGQIVKEITLRSDQDDHPQHPAIVPYDIAFTRSGMGMVLLRASGASIMRWKLVDSRNNHEVTEYPGTISGTNYFDGLYMNHDQSKLIITQTYIGSCDYGIFDGQTQKVSLLRTPTCTRSGYIAPSRKDGNIFFGHLIDQFIMNLNGKTSLLSYLNPVYDSSVDFSYRASDENIIFHSDGKFLQLLDYNRSATLMSCNVVPHLLEFMTTVDARSATAYRVNNNLTSDFYVFDTESLYRYVK
ncbi:hypothetical protein GZH53_13670 [Flavihumibacter sp. R14]|nr:hypothetical protein [Flavihumibacter soli]